MTVSKKHAQMVRTVEHAMFMAGHDVREDGRLDAKEKKELKKIQEARGLKPTGKVNQKTVKSLKRMEKQVEHQKPFVLGQRTDAIAQKEAEYLKAGKIKKKNADGILDKPTKKLIDAERAQQQALEGQSGFDPNAYNQFYNSQFPSPSLTSEPDPTLPSYNARWFASFPNTPVTGSTANPELAQNLSQWQNFLRSPGDEQPTTGDVIAPTNPVLE